MIIVGLGNPGKKYEHTRHNAGHLLIDFLKRNQKSKTANYQLMQTDCFMNVSGGFVKKILTNNRQLSTKDLYIAHDDLDLPLGRFKISFARGPKVHNGILSIEDALGTADFWRIRIGVDNRMSTDSVDDEHRTAQRSTTNPSASFRASHQPPTNMSGEEYVLSDLDEKERSILDTVFDTIAQALI